MRVQKVSLETIAKIAGVHKATVSRSLRNHPAIPFATRERIQQIARDLGYRPNPFVSMFQSQARSNRPASMQATLGWLNDYPQESCWTDFPWLRGYFEGARERCEEMGYRLETIPVRPAANDSSTCPNGDGNSLASSKSTVVRLIALKVLRFDLKHPITDENE